MDHFIYLKRLIIENGDGDNFLEDSDSTYKADDRYGQLNQVDSGGFDEDSYYSSVQVYRVWHFVDHDIYIRFDGSYTSYEGLNFENMKQVFPKQINKIIYE